MKVQNKQLSDFLSDSGIVDKESLDKALASAEKEKKFLGQILLERSLIEEEQLQKMYAYILGIPFVRLEKKVIDPNLLSIIPAPVAKKFHVVAFERDNSNLKVAMLDPDDLQTIDFIRKKSGYKIQPCLTGKTDIEFALKQYEKSLQAEFGDLIDADTHEETRVEAQADDNDLEKVAQDVPVIRIVDTLLKHAILQKASDIHIEPTERDVVVRYRIDGILHDAMNLPGSIISGLIARIKVLANLKLDEHRLPQDGRFKIEKEGYRISFRVSVLPVFDGEKIVMRLLNESSEGLTLEKMGFLTRDLEVIHREIKKPNGMILVTGPTGSGKTTTLYTIMDILNTQEVNISTVEDPVEYRMPRINQTQVNPKIGMTFSAALRALLRQDPDIIMIGEIRDSETMEIALHAAMTGHLVLSTLHTNSAAAALPRLLDMGAEPFLVASTINIIIAQRLVRRLCSDCKQEYSLDSASLTSFKESFDADTLENDLKESSDLGFRFVSWEKAKFFRPVGCAQCGDEGYRGRLGIYEVLEMTSEMGKLVTSKAATEEIASQSRKDGMRVMIQDGIIKALGGITSIEEVLRVTKE